MKEPYIFIFCYMLASVICAQELHVDGDILLNQGNDRTISVENASNGNGHNLTIRAGNTFSLNQNGGNLNLFGGNGDNILFGNGGNVIIRPGVASGGGVIDIQASGGSSLARFTDGEIDFHRRTRSNGLSILRNSSIIGTGNESAYGQLEFTNPTNQLYKWILGPQSSPVATTDNDFYFYVDRGSFGSRKVAGFIQDHNKNVQMNFTGQHRSLIRGIDFSDPDLDEEDLSGLIVVADQNEYMSMSGGLTVGQEAIMIDESLPVVSLSSKPKDKRVFGVISGIEAEDRNDVYGAFATPYEKEVGDQRVFVNSIGEGGIWVIDQDGELSSGDYIVTSIIPGYGMRQESEFLANYTVAKITMDCTFDPEVISKKKIKKRQVIIEELVSYENVLDEMGRLIWEQTCDKQGQPIFESAYKMRYLLPDGTRISKKEYVKAKLKRKEVYRAAFVGCTYHCG